MKKVMLFMVFVILSIAAMGETLQDMYDKSYNASIKEIYNQIAVIVSERDKNIKEMEEKKKNIKKEEFEKTADFQKRKLEEEKNYNEEIIVAKNESEKALKNIREQSYKEEIKVEYKYNADDEKMVVYFENRYFEFLMKLDEAKAKKENMKSEILYKITSENKAEIVGVTVSVKEEENSIIAIIEGKNVKINKYVNVEGNGEIKDLIIGRYEVTQGEYKTIMGYNPSKFKGENLPVEMVTWYDAVVYCNKLSEKEKLPKYYNIKNISKSGNNIVKAIVTIIGGKGYKLPTDEEWVWAAKGGKYSKGYTYSGSDNIDEVAWYDSNSGNNTHEIGTKLPNELGVYDMSGNVFEWNETSYIGSCRYFRGGSWLNVVNVCEVDFQYYSGENDKGNSLGFRVCRILI